MHIKKMNIKKFIKNNFIVFLILEKNWLRSYLVPNSILDKVVSFSLIENYKYFLFVFLYFSEIS